MIVGMLSGWIIMAAGGDDSKWKSDLAFNEHLFALIFLPVIIFQSGYSLSLSHFFKVSRVAALCVCVGGWVGVLYASSS